MAGPPPKDAVVRSTVSGMASNYVTVASEGFLQLAVLILLARLLDPADFGLVASAMVAVELANMVSQFGIRVVVIRHPSLTPRLVRAAFSLALLVGAVAMLVVWLGAPAVGLFFRSEVIADLLRVLSLRFLLGSVGRVAEALLERNLAWRKLMYVGVASYALGYAVPASVLAALGFGAWALVGAYLGQALLRSALVLFIQPHPKGLVLRGGELREVSRFGGEYTLARFFSYLAMQGDYLIVGRVLGAELLGFYTRAFKLIELPVNYFAQVVTKVLLPVMARMQDTQHRIRTTYLAGSAVVTLVSAPLSTVMVLTAPEIVRVLLGPNWLAATTPFQILALGVMFRNGYLIGTSLDGALGAMSQRALRNAIYAAAVIVGSLVGVRFGLEGVALGVLAAVVLHYLLTAGLSLRLVGGSWREYLESQAPGLVLALAVIAVAAPVRVLLQWLELPALAILSLVSILSVAAVIALLLAFPVVLGRHGTEAVRALLGIVSHRIRPPGFLVHYLEKGPDPAIEAASIEPPPDQAGPPPSPRIASAPAAHEESSAAGPSPSATTSRR